jgi:hypothetical protein
VKLADDGTFSTSIDLTEGRWTVTVTAAGEEGKSTTLTRDVTVVYRGVTVVIEIREQRRGCGVRGQRHRRPDRGRRKVTPRQDDHLPGRTVVELGPAR